MQTGKPDKEVSGSASIVIDGLQGGKPQSLDFAEISPNRRASLAYSFRYFEDYDEIVRLPKGFEPTRVGVELHSGKDQSSRVPAGVRVEGAGNVGRDGSQRRRSPKDSADVQTETE